MACPAIQTGTRFLVATLAHLDCQARDIGAYGYGALADPGSDVTLALTGLLVLFVAVFGVRLLLGHVPLGSDVVGGVLRIGLVLTLAASWPAWRTVGYAVVLDAPAELAGTIGGRTGLDSGRSALENRLQEVDDGLVAITAAGTGRLTEQVIVTDRYSPFGGIALADQNGFGWGRVAFLSGVIGTRAIVAIGAGVLLALAPLMAGLALFGGSMGLFVGWVRGLAFCALASLGLAMVHGVEATVLQPWIGDVLAQRGGGGLAPSAPTELTALAAGFALASFGMLALVARLAFYPHLARLVRQGAPWLEGRAPEPAAPAGSLTIRSETSAPFAPSRARVIAEAMASGMRREERVEAPASPTPAGKLADSRGIAAPPPATAGNRPADELLGSSLRRTAQRASAAGQNRDGRA